MITATARRRKGHRHEVDADGHLVVVDEPTDAGGTDGGPSPTRLLAASLASCTAITIGMYADRKEWDIEGLHAEITTFWPTEFTVEALADTEWILHAASQERKSGLPLPGRRWLAHSRNSRERSCASNEPGRQSPQVNTGVNRTPACFRDCTR